MSMLQDGWAGHGTLAPTPAAIDRAKLLGAYLIDRDLAVPDPNLGTDGDLILEFPCDDNAKRRTVVQIRSNGEAIAYTVTPENDAPTHLRRVAMHIRSLCDTPNSGVYSYLSRG
ncbi:hypothetical protein [Aeromicrobium sp. 179-A 4D2 NHS]|uniref:hypothetical protein n=1 Tax=Aeromicrobium sp. 179-A 4D2 NHS TaxID=3142375 RepID=UPI0039A0D4EC